MTAQGAENSLKIVSNNANLFFGLAHFVVEKCDLRKYSCIFAIQSAGKGSFENGNPFAKPLMFIFVADCINNLLESGETALATDLCDFFAGGTGILVAFCNSQFFRGLIGIGEHVLNQVILYSI